MLKWKKKSTNSGESWRFWELTEKMRRKIMEKIFVWKACWNYESTTMSSLQTVGLSNWSTNSYKSRMHLGKTKPSLDPHPSQTKRKKQKTKKKMEKLNTD
jgi:hypothetical protein